MKMRLMSLAIVVFVLDACGFSPPIQYYQLSSQPTPRNQEISEGGKPGAIIGIGPVDIPPYVDRLQLVTRSGEHVLELAEFDRWAEPLPTDVTRVLVENLSQFLSQEQAVIVSWEGNIPSDYQVQIEVTRFDFNTNGGTFLSANWTILGKDERQTLVLRTSQYSQTAASEDYASMVAAMSRNLKRLSQEIGSALKPLL